MSTGVSSSVSFATLITPGAERALFYADALTKTIPAELFTKKPKDDVNSPAFNIGHLSIYPDMRLLPLIGRDDLVKPLPFSIDLFKAGSPCVDEPGKYPHKDVIVSTFMDRYRCTIEALAGVPDEFLARPNPLEGRLREIFPTIGGAINFLLVGHPQSHLGQVSVWRRIMGLGSAL